MTKKFLLSLIQGSLFCTFTPTAGMLKDLTPYLAFNHKKLTPIASDGSFDTKNALIMENPAISLSGTLHIHPLNRCAISFTNNGNSIKMEIPLSEQQIDYILTKYSCPEEYEENIFYYIENQLIGMKTINDCRPKPAISIQKTSPEKSLSCVSTHKQIFSIAAGSFIILAVLSYLLHE